MTNLLYSLMIFNERLEGFFIGLFESREKARQAAEHYLSALPGFRDYPCTYEITEKLVVGIIGQSQKVHMIWGWDEDEAAHEQAGVEPGYLPHWSMPLDRGLCKSLFFRIREIKYI